MKRKTNDELRQRFVNLTVPQAQAIGLTLPDPDLRYNEATENWEFGEIDWAEFFEVVEGQRAVQSRAARRASRGARRGRVGARRGQRLRREADRRATEAA